LLTDELNQDSLMKHVLRLALVALVVVFAGIADASYPESPIRIIVTIPPGGAPDIAAGGAAAL
jgi:tripartite-type tricarboxylate transporter receptor subunit TctC